MEVLWDLQRNASVPAGDAWLGPRELSVQSGLKVQKRREDWRVGRYAAKRLISELVGVQALDRIEILAAEDGAPEATVDGHAVDLSLSITHRRGLAACAVVRGCRVGCDLEVIEPRSARFVEDYLAEGERLAVERTPAPLRERHVALTWSAKESALKVLRVGLRRDTRSVLATIATPEASGDRWSGLVVAMEPEGKVLRGWWRQLDDWVLTVACEEGGSHIAGHDEQR
jgi:4'-phosphopantetheinyl transferase